VDRKYKMAAKAGKCLDIGSYGKTVNVAKFSQKKY
jgi:hypothetical protein